LNFSKSNILVLGYNEETRLPSYIPDAKLKLFMSEYVSQLSVCFSYA